jgi:two-component system cell cycle response regulator
MPGEVILIVDDVPINLKLTGLLLRREGYLVETASGGEEALALLGRLKCDLILTDVQMPGINGYELTRRVRQDPRLHKLPVVAITASGAEGGEQIAFEAGCNGYLTKPIDTRTIATRIREYLDQDRGHPADVCA